LEVRSVRWIADNEGFGLQQYRSSLLSYSSRQLLKPRREHEMKKLLVVAVVALAAPALAKAETANVNVYGTINTAVEAIKSGTPTVGEAITGRMRLASYSSNFGIKGSEDLSEGLKGIFQIETDLDAALGTLNANAFGLRNTGLGLDSGFGRAILGKWDTPFKTAATFADPFYGSSGWMQWDIPMATRQTGSINYWSPRFFGAGVQLYYAPKTATGNVSNDYHYGGALTYSDMGLNAAVAYNYDNAADDSTKSTGLKAAAGYTLFDTTTINVGYVAFTATEKAASVDTKSKSLLFSATHKLGDVTFRGAYGITGKTSIAGVDQADTGYKQLSVGAGYGLSKRTEVYGVFSKISNEPALARNFSPNPVNGGVGILAGADPQLFGIGVKHAF